MTPSVMQEYASVTRSGIAVAVTAPVGSGDRSEARAQRAPTPVLVAAARFIRSQKRLTGYPVLGSENTDSGATTMTEPLLGVVSVWQAYLPRRSGRSLAQGWTAPKQSGSR